MDVVVEGVQQVELVCFASSFWKWQCQAYLTLIITCHHASRDWMETRKLHAWLCNADWEIKNGDMPGACSSWLHCVGRYAHCHSPPIDKAVKWPQAIAPVLQGQKKMSHEFDCTVKIRNQRQLYFWMNSVFFKKYNISSSQFDLLICVNYLYVVIVCFPLDFETLISSYFYL